MGLGYGGRRNCEETLEYWNILRHFVGSVHRRGFEELN